MFSEEIIELKSQSDIKQENYHYYSIVFDDKKVCHGLDEGEYIIQGTNICSGCYSPKFEKILVGIDNDEREDFIRYQMKIRHDEIRFLHELTLYLEENERVFRKKVSKYFVSEYNEIINRLRWEYYKNNPFMNPSTFSDKIFIVHGHDELLQLKVARAVQKLGLQPIILHEQSNSGKTIIEKFEAHSDVGFAIILLTADDLGCSKKASENSPRARQNVILEMGYFIGKLGRDRVFPLYEDRVELPNDLSGVVYTPIDGPWELKLIKELQVAGYQVDANKIL